ncbi:RNA 2',3'-cyclic phosphodiesterase [uncultured archaeon]|nr:RNA 2',3'-cyclic phosphodiesterase [uncultured archaeon]
MVKLIAAIVPEEPYLSLIREWQLEFNRLYGGNEVLEYPVHNTLVSVGNVCDEDSLKKVYRRVFQTAAKTKPFRMHVDGARFHGSNEKAIGIYLDVKKTDELQLLHNALVSELRDLEDGSRAYKELELYSPHISVWYPDNLKELTKSACLKENSAEMINYKDAMQHVPERKEPGWPPRFSLGVGQICLLYKAEDMNNYRIFEEFVLLA